MSNAAEQGSRDRFAVIKTFHTATWVGLFLALAFVVSCMVTTLALRWWLMIPLAAASCTVLGRRARSAPRVERKAALVALWIVVALFLFRDVALSRKLAELYDSIEGIKGPIKDLFS